MYPTLNWAEAREPTTLLQVAQLEKRLVLTLAGLLALGFGIVIVLVELIASDSGTSSRAPWSQLPIEIVVAAVVSFDIIWTVLHFRRGRYTERCAQRFALTNGFHYSASPDDREWQGVIFGIGKERHLGPLIEGQHRNLHFWLGNYYYVSGNSRHNTRNSYGFVRIELSRQLPHVLLDSIQNNFIEDLDDMQSAGLPRDYKKFQRYELEGDFNNYFTVYAPARYERDMLYFLTPELMALLVDYAADLDIEIIDDYLYIYAMKPIVFNAETLQRLFTVMEAVGAETLENTARYRDNRASIEPARVSLLQGKGSVMSPGRRLVEKRPSWVVAIVVWAAVAVAMYLLYSNDFSQ